jgi:hypothetical protein
MLKILNCPDPAGSVAFSDIVRLQGEFTARAIRDWDEAGQGDFKLWVMCYVSNCWTELTELN